MGIAREARRKQGIGSDAKRSKVSAAKTKKRKSKAAAAPAEESEEESDSKMEVDNDEPPTRKMKALKMSQRDTSFGGPKQG